MKLLKPYNDQMKRVLIPYFVITLVLICFYSINWFAVAVFMLFLGIIGNGIAGHRMMAHKQFNPANWVKQILYFLCTVAAFSPLWFWRAQHWHHHKYSDQEVDVHSPQVHSLWHSFIWWATKQETVSSIVRSEIATVRESLRDPAVKFYAIWNYQIIWIFVISLYFISPGLLLSYLIYFWIEVFRLGTLTTLLHVNLPFSYQNFNTGEHSRNNLILGHLTFGLG